MAEWNKTELQKIGETDDFHISPFREDGKTYGTPTWIWSVVVGDELFVRAYYGKKSSWYNAAIKQKGGRITAAAISKEVTFEQVDGEINNLIDSAYDKKYKGSPYLKSMISDRVRTATVKVIPNTN